MNAPADPLEQLEIELLLEGIYRHYGADFRNYARNSLRRRLNLAVHDERVANVSSLQARVLHDPAAMERLARQLSVPVTAMFRDPPFFQALREQVIPILRSHPFVRVWHAGCATGEEVYSLAIVLREEGLLDRARIYATDMNEDALAAARAGRYPLAQMREYTENYQQAGGRGDFSRYYKAGAEDAVFDAELRRNVVFAAHNLVTDASFNEFNLILCRNVLIYFNATLQARVRGLLHASLSRRGVLCLGRRETLDQTELLPEYEPLDVREKIWRRRG